MNKKIVIIGVLAMLLMTSFAALPAMSLNTTNEQKIYTNRGCGGESVDKIQLTKEEVKQLYIWCKSIDDIKIQQEVEHSLKETINSAGELYITILEEKLESISHSYSPQPLGILPAIAIVKCVWKITSDSAGERTIHFWIIGFGHHELTWDTLDDFDGDGTWDLGPGTPWNYEWFALLFPIRHFHDWASWSGYPGRAKVQVNYALDGSSSVKTFQEPANDQNILQLGSASNQLNIQSGYNQEYATGYNINIKQNN